MKLKISVLVIVCLLFSVTPQAYSRSEEEQALKTAMSIQNLFTSVASRLKPSVVNIRIEREAQSNIRWMTPDGEEAPGGIEEFFEHFFRRAPGLRRPPRQERFRTEAAGSGVIIDTEGLILTNNHVIDNAHQITVKFYDGDERPAEVVGQDPQTDLAIIRVEGRSDLTPAKFANSDEVKVGQWAIAVGNPLGLEQTVTIGVVSALGRSGIGATTIEDFIQTDASINPGNSGGPLVNIEGKVVGINTLIFNAPGSGIGFAIPSNMASRIAWQIANDGMVHRPYLGISMQPVTSELATHYGLENRYGAVVLQLMEDSPAEKSGLKPMDIIIAINGEEMQATSDVQRFVFNRNVDEVLDITILRDGEKKNIEVKLEQMPESFGIASAPARRQRSKESESTELNELGITVQSQAEGASNKTDKQLVITNITQDSQAEKAGLRRGDIISQVNSKEVTTEQELEKALKRRRDKSSVFLIRRGNAPMFLILKHED